PAAASPAAPAEPAMNPRRVSFAMVFSPPQRLDGTIPSGQIRSRARPGLDGDAPAAAVRAREGASHAAAQRDVAGDRPPHGAPSLTPLLASPGSRLSHATWYGRQRQVDQWESAGVYAVRPARGDQGIRRGANATVLGLDCVLCGSARAVLRLAGRGVAAEHCSQHVRPRPLGNEV